MGSISKHRNSVDRLSNLLRDLISHILSFLPTKDVLRTSILSTFWNQQWVSITKLNFDNTSPSTKSTMSSRASFVNIVYRVLLFTEVTHLDVFQLKCSLRYFGTHVNTWVSSALSRDVRKLDLLFLPSNGVCPLPCCLFTSKSLVSLELGTDIVIDVPESISFECLKILHLISGLVGYDYWQYEDDDFEPIRYSGLCMLFNLKIVEIRSFKGLDVELEIVRYLLKMAKCLKKLTISYYRGIKENEAEVSKKLLILPRSSDSCEIELT